MKYMSFTFVELPKFGDQCSKDINKLSLEEKFYYFLHKAPAMSDTDLEKLTGKDIIIKEAFDELERFSWTKEELNAYEQVEKRDRDNFSALCYAKEEGLKEGKKEGIAEGIEKGKQEGLAEGMEKTIALLKKQGVDKALIEALKRELSNA